MCRACKNDVILKRLHKRAMKVKGVSQYHISCVALNKKGEVLGYTTNRFRKDKINPIFGSGCHAEAWSMARYYAMGAKTLIIMRVGNDGKLLPIDPCEDCQKMANKLGIEIISVFPGTGPKPRKEIIRKQLNGEMY